MTHRRRLHDALTALIVSLLLAGGTAACAARTASAQAAPAAAPTAPPAPTPAPAPAAAPTPGGTVAGAFTAVQAERGRAVYTKACSSCHLDDLSGSDQAPALAGDSFVSFWVGMSAGDLVDRVRTTMPLDNPGNLSAAAAIDIVAFVLQSNRFPAGSQELTRDTIRTVTITR